MSGKQGRISYKEAGTIGREALARALKQNESKTALRVLASLVSLTSLYSKQEDRISISQIMEFGDLSKASVTDGLRELRTAAIISREPSSGGRDASGKGYSGLIRILSDLEASSVRTEGTLKCPSNPELVSEKHPSKCPDQGDTPRSTREEYREGKNLGFTVPGDEPLLAAPKEDATAQRENPRTTLVTTDTVWCRCGVGFSGDDLHHAEDKYANHAGHCGDRPVYEPLYARPVHAA